MLSRCYYYVGINSIHVLYRRKYYIYGLEDLRNLHKFMPKSCDIILGHLIIELASCYHNQGTLGHFIVFINLKKVKGI